MQPDQTAEMLESLRRQMDEDEWWAREASRPAGGTEGSDPPPGGVHWQWECGRHDQPVGMDPALDEMLACPVDEDCFEVSLRSVEDFPTRSVGPLPLFAVPHAEEQPVAPAGHIIRHDPARVLRLIAGHRRILDEYESLAAECQGEPESAAVLAWVERVVLPALADVYTSQPAGPPP